MSSRTAALLALVACMLFALGAAAGASAADFNPGPSTYTADTTALTLTGPGTSLTGTDQGGVAVFGFDNVSIPAGATINVKGSRPFKLLASGSLTLAGLIDGRGANATDGVPGPLAGGPGAGAGGADRTQAGGGPGGGGIASDSENGGGGGGFGATGARGGIKVGDPGTAGAGGAFYGDLNALLQGGSGGGGGAFVGGGGGGGAIALFGSSVTVTGAVRADGGGGAVGGGGASGGGSGGGIVVHGETVEITGLLDAAGGEGGAGGCCGDGGGGSGGRIAYQYRTLIASGTAIVSGGTSGTRWTSGPFSHGGLSPDVTGAAGVVTKTQAPTASTGPATAVSSTGATLNGTVNPNSNATTYHFDFGTTGAYGARVPASEVSVGSNAADHVVSTVIGGLAPNTTYHYRVVAINGVGFTTTGPDVGFTTLAAPLSPPPPPNTILSKAKIKAKKGTATFKFKAVGKSTGFQCALTKKHKKAKFKFKKCSSPKTYTNLKPGKYTFKVRAIGPGGSDPSPAQKNFEIE